MTERTHHYPEHRPDAIGGDWEWQLQGSCRTVDSELFFHPYGEREPSRSRRERAALAVCGTCPVLLPCRTYALQAREPYGVWGGLTETDRQDILAGRRPPLERHSPSPSNPLRRSLPASA